MDKDVDVSADSFDKMITVMMKVILDGDHSLDSQDFVPVADS